jgi:short-subunit dehydrogenase
VIAESESLYYELALTESNVGVSVVCPGFVSTNLLRQDEASYADSDDDKYGKVAAAFEKGVAEGLAPETVAEMTIEAIRTDRLHVLTHSYSAEFLYVRFDPILAGENLPVSDKLKDTFAT